MTELVNILDILRQDYQNFPNDQHFELYDDNVRFKDPLTEFQGIRRYQAMIGFMGRWFQDICLDLHEITRNQNLITTFWKLQWTTPLPWQPRIQISGRSELQINNNGKIASHVDYWDCSAWSVLIQHFQVKQWPRN